MIGPDGRADAGAFLVRVLRLDARALVRLRPSSPDTAQLWCMLPFGVLATRVVAARLDRDSTVEAAALLRAVDDESGVLPPRRDELWRWPLPPSRGSVVETVPAPDVARIAMAASRTLRAASTQGVGGRAVGERVVRDTLLDHIPIVATGASGERAEVPQRLVQALVRMGFIGVSESVTAGDALVTIRQASGWVGLDGSYGSVWYRPNSELRLSRGVDVGGHPFR